MSHVPSDLKYTRTHEWIRQLEDGNVEIGISEHAQAALGELVFVEIPAAGRTLALGEAFAVVESVKAASDVYSPLAGEVVAGNTQLSSTPEKVNEEPYGSGWLMRLRPAAGGEPPQLLSAADYQKFLDTEA